jgi:hypothetical protein
MRHRIVNNVSSVGAVAVTWLDRMDRTDNEMENTSLGLIASVINLGAFEDDSVLAVNAGCKMVGDSSDDGAEGGGLLGCSSVVASVSVD